MKIEKIFLPIVAMLLAIALFAATPFWSMFIKDHKELTYKVLTTSGLSGLAFSQDDWPEISIQYGGNEISDGGFVSVIFKSTGTLPIEKQDFDQPLVIRFDDAAEIVGFRPGDPTPAGLSPTMRVNGNVVEIDPLLLNPGDTFYFEFLMDHSLDVIDVSARIVGVESLTKSEQKDESGLHLVYVQDSPNSPQYFERRLLKLYEIPLFSLSLLGLLLLVFFYRIRDQLISQSARTSINFMLIYIYASATLLAYPAAALFAIDNLAHWITSVLKLFPFVLGAVALGMYFAEKSIKSHGS